MRKHWWWSFIALFLLTGFAISAAIGFAFAYQWEGHFERQECVVLNLSKSMVTSCGVCTFLSVDIIGGRKSVAAVYVTSFDVLFPFACKPYTNSTISNQIACWVPTFPLPYNPNLTLSSCLVSGLHQYVVVNDGDPPSARGAFALGGAGAVLFSAFLAMSLPWCLLVRARYEVDRPFAQNWFLCILCVLYYISHAADMSSIYLDAIIGLFIAISFEQFQSTAGLLIVLVVLVLISDYPRQQSPQFHQRSFIRWRAFALILEAAQLSVGSMCLSCEAGFSAASALCVASTRSLSAANGFVILVLCIAIFEASLKIIIHASLLVAAWCAYVLPRTYEREPNNLALASWAKLCYWWVFWTRNVFLKKKKDERSDE